MKEFYPSRFYILSRKLIYLKWQEILVSLVKTYEGLEALPIIDSSSLKRLVSMYIPNDFDKLIVVTKELSSFILSNDSIKTSKTENSYPVAGILALSGWRIIEKNNDAYKLECPCCLRTVDSSLLE